MRACAPFQPDDLAALDELLSRAYAVVPMEDIADGLADDLAVGMRHDCDNVIEPAIRMAEWEAERGYRATYYVLHGTAYWSDKRLLRSSLEAIAGYGHAIGIHNNAVAEAIATERDPQVILGDAIEELRDYGFTIRSTVAHGDPLCYDELGRARVVNDELFLECPRAQYGAANRTVASIPLSPVPLATFALEFDSNWLPRGDYLSDSGGQWSQPFVDVAAAFPPLGGQLHLLLHPCWWGEAFKRDAVAA